jgi:hypothetical protein
VFAEDPYPIGVGAVAPVRGVPGPGDVVPVVADRPPGVDGPDGGRRTMIVLNGEDSMGLREDAASTWRG